MNVTPTEALVAAFEDAASMCGAVALPTDFDTEDCAFIWCGAGLVVGFEITPGMTPEDVFLETLVSIELSDDPEMNVAADDPPDSPVWTFEQIGDLTPAQRAQTDTWVGLETATLAANPQRYVH